MGCRRTGASGPARSMHCDAWTEPSGYEWRYDADRNDRDRAPPFQIHALAGKQRSSSTQDSAAVGDGEGSGGGNLKPDHIDPDYDPWPEIEGRFDPNAAVGGAVDAR